MYWLPLFLSNPDRYRYRSAMGKLLIEQELHYPNALNHKDYSPEQDTDACGCG